jgi:phosphoglycolate phosphatase
MGTIFFDLDGTLADTSEDIFISLNKTLRKFNIKEIDFDVVLSYVGDGVRPLIQKILKQLGAEEKEEEILKDFISEYRKNIAHKTYIYKGNTELIFKMKRKNHKVILTTNKSHKLTVSLLSSLHIAQIFDGIVGGDTFDVKKPEAKLLEKIEQTLKINRPTLVIGDGINDLVFAEKTNSIFLFAKWGFLPQRVKKFIEENKISIEVIEAENPQDAEKKLKSIGWL